MHWPVIRQVHLQPPPQPLENRPGPAQSGPLADGSPTPRAALPTPGFHGGHTGVSQSKCLRPKPAPREEGASPESLVVPGLPWLSSPHRPTWATQGSSEIDPVIPPGFPESLALC